MAQVARPISTVATGGWAPTGAATCHAALAEPVADDAASYAGFTGLLLGGPASLIVGLAPLAVPLSRSGHSVSFRATGGGLLIGYTVALLQDTTAIATTNLTAPAAAYATGTLQLTAAQADTITDYGALRLRITHNGGLGQIRATQAFLETPDPLPKTVFPGGGYSGESNATGAPRARIAAASAAWSGQSNGAGGPVVARALPGTSMAGETNGASGLRLSVGLPVAATAQSDLNGPLRSAPRLRGSAEGVSASDGLLLLAGGPQVAVTAGSSSGGALTVRVAARVEFDASTTANGWLRSALALTGDMTSTGTDVGQLVDLQGFPAAHAQATAETEGHLATATCLDSQFEAAAKAGGTPHRQLVLPEAVSVYSAWAAGRPNVLHGLASTLHADSSTDLTPSGTTDLVPGHMDARAVVAGIPTMRRSLTGQLELETSIGGRPVLADFVLPSMPLTATTDTSTTTTVRIALTGTATANSAWTLAARRRMPVRRARMTIRAPTATFDIREPTAAFRILAPMATLRTIA